MSKLKEALKQRIQNIQEVKSKKVRVGIVGHQHYDDENKTPVAYVAAIHEYGSPSNNIPPRPFFRPTIAEKKGEWVELVCQSLKHGASLENALDSVGLRASADVFETLSNVASPPLALSTKLARNRKAYKNGGKPKAISIKPLYDTGLLQASISFEVVD